MTTLVCFAFLECVVAKQVRVHIFDVLEYRRGQGFISVGSNRKFAVHNVITYAALWGLWKLRNMCCFSGLWLKYFFSELDSRSGTNWGYCALRTRSCNSPFSLGD